MLERSPYLKLTYCGEEHDDEATEHGYAVANPERKLMGIRSADDGGINTIILALIIMSRSSPVWSNVLKSKSSLTIISEDRFSYLLVTCLTKKMQ